MTERVLLTGATGFVGSRLEPVLRAAGHDVLCASRNPDAARAKQPGRTWIPFDVADRDSIRRALEGRTAAYYLVHELRGGGDYPEREAKAADAFAIAAREAGLRRVVYLGGVAPAGAVSKHLRSRLRTGELLRASAPTIELRAAMIVGRGSASWTMVRDLSARLPAMVLPKWTRFRSSPVAIDDVLAALSFALEMPSEAGSEWLDVPGPETMTHAEILRRAAAVFGKRPPMLPVPVLTPLLSSYWVALVTRVDLPMARELVAGLQSDLVPSGPSIWDRMPPRELASFERAIRVAIDEEQRERSHVARGRAAPSPAE